MAETPAGEGGARRRTGIWETVQRTFARLFAGTVPRVLFVLLLAVLVPVLAAQLGLSLSLLQDWRSQQLQSTLRVARGVSATMTAYVRDLLREELALGVAIAPPVPLSLDRATQVLSAASSQYPAVRSFNWLSPEGVVIASSDPTAVGADVSARDDVRAILGGQGTAVSDLQQPAGGAAPFFAVAEGIRDPRGRLEGIVTAVIEPADLGLVLSPERVGDAPVAVVDRRGTLVYRRPEASLPGTGSDVASAVPLVPQALGGQEVTGTFTSPVDGRERLAGAAPIPSFGWAALASVPTAVAMAPAIASELTAFAVLLGVGLAGVILALAISRLLTDPIGRLSRSARAIGQGDLTQRPSVSRPDELAALAGAISAMAEQLQQREEQREDIVRAVSHDLRNPLAALQGQAQLLLRRLERSGHDGAERASVEAILTDAHRMNAQIQDLVDSVRSEAGELHLERRPVELGPFLSDLLRRQVGALDTKRINVELPGGLPPVSADPNRLERILVNLLSNALKYSAPGSDVTVSSRQEDGEIVTSVADRGAGIPPEQLPYLFERYYRTEAGREQREGIGLGLYVTRMLVEAHGGRIWAQSAPGVGSTFSFTLPVVSQTAPAPG